jgi:hypothetical protein
MLLQVLHFLVIRVSYIYKLKYGAVKQYVTLSASVQPFKCEVSADSLSTLQFKIPLQDCVSLSCKKGVHLKGQWCPIGLFRVKEHRVVI